MSPRSLVLLLICVSVSDLCAQDLEPRRWSHLPTNINIAGTGLVATDGDIHFDPVQRIEDAQFEMYSVAKNYVHSFEFLGKTSRLEFRVPYSMGRWEGVVNGNYVSTRRHGFSDPRARFAMNLIGAPPLKGAEYLQYRAANTTNTVVGAALVVTLPLGEYNSQRLINLGGNRTVYRPQLGVLHIRGSWQFELTTTLSIFEDNDDFFGGTVIKQDPMWFFEGHIVRTFSKGRWLGLSSGYSYDGESSVNGIAQNNDEHTRYLALSYGMPISKSQSIKLTYLNADTNVLIGNSLDSVILSWSVNWLSK